MIEVTDIEKEMIKRRFQDQGQPVSDEEAITIVRSLKESRRWKQFIEMKVIA
jgi:hypothetical protein